VLAAHTSACSLPEPPLARDVNNALMHIRENASCDKLLNAATTAAVAVSPSAVQQLAMKGPSWVPFPIAIASEYLEYFSKKSTLELAAAATLLRQQQQLKSKNSRQLETTITKTTEVSIGKLEPAAARAELLAMALCLPLPQRLPSQLEQEVEAEEEEGHIEEERAKRKLLKRLPEDPLAVELCSFLHSTPTLAVSLPAPLLARACRSSFPFSIEYAAALKRLREESSSGVPLTAVIGALKHACLTDDTTALLFKDALESIYSSI
jgi:hypothetical protein